MLEATQTATSPILFKAGRQWEGRVINNFRLRQYLGSTEHSAVFLTDLPGDVARKAAIKLIAASPDADVQLGRWRLAAKLAHPHLLQIFEVGSCQISGDSLLFVVMEYADEALSQILPERPLSEAEAREMLKPTLDTLSYLHENGFIQGHLSPSNILVVGEQLKLASDHLCRSGSSAPSGLQKDAYLPPEADQEGVTPASDVWSLGTILVESLTQRLPEWNNRLLEEPSIPTEIRQPFTEIARHCLLRDPRSRWTVAQIFTALEPPPVPAKPKRESQAVQQERKDRPRRDVSTWIFGGVMVVVVAVALLIATLFRHSSSPQPSPATSSEIPATTSSKAPTGASARTSSMQPASQTGIVHQVLPAVPESALQTIEGRVRVVVKVNVDSGGNVTGAEFEHRGPSQYFAALAMQAARQFKFASGNGSGTKLVQFTFESSGVKVHLRD